MATRKSCGGEPVLLHDMGDDIAWEQTNRAALSALRRRCRDWGAPASPASPVTWTERTWIECVKSSAPPTNTVLRAFAEHPSDGPSPWLLFCCRRVGLPSLVRDALAIVSPLELALAVRAWEPDIASAHIRHKFVGVKPVGIMTTQAELKRHRADLRQLTTEARHMAAAAAAADRIVGSSDLETWDGVIADRAAARKKTVDAQRVARLQQRRDATAAWLEDLAKRSERDSALLDAIDARPKAATRLGPALERATASARRRWWLPVERKLRESQPASFVWDEHRLASLILVKGVWLVDLVPWVRAKYDDGAGLGKLKAIMRDGRRIESRDA